MEVERVTEQLLVRAKQLGVSDIHMMPEGKRYVVYYYLADKLQKALQFTYEEGEKIIGYLKFLANMNVGERRKPQGGSIQLKVEDSSIYLRCSLMSNYEYRESLVIRILKKSNQIDLERTCFFPQELAKVRRLFSYSSGLLIFSGPVNSGKTTTMYQFARERVADKHRQVIAIEDPVEIKEAKFLQIQVNEAAGMTYEVLLKAALRHHPDLIILGEIRDSLTAKMAIRAALTGHLVITTIHGRYAQGVLKRLSELGISQIEIEQTLMGVVYQRLISKTCPFCLDKCSLWCTHFKVDRKRNILFEVWDDSVIHRYLRRQVLLQKETFKIQLRKVYAYGYISKTTYEEIKD